MAREVSIIGDGVIGLSIAIALADRGVTSTVIGTRLPGAASLASAGLLAPSIGRVIPPVRSFYFAARDAYPLFIDRLADRSGVRPELNRRGLIELARDAKGFADLCRHAPPWAEPLPQQELARLEPSLAQAPGALLHPSDGFVDNVALVGALDRAVAREPRITRVLDLVETVDLGQDAGVTTAAGARYEAGILVLAAGAWSARLPGLPSPIPIEPLHGEMLAVEAPSAALAHAVTGAEGYLVPRGDRVLVGSTEEQLGFSVRTSDANIGRLRSVLAALCPPLADAPEQSRWAGLRPVTPDKRPIIGPDPSAPQLFYACGHSKNGILLAALTAAVTADSIVDGSTSVDLSPFALSRFTHRRGQAAR